MVKSQGVTDARVLQALARLSRARFLPPDQRIHATTDRALPIGLEQTISQPLMVAVMTERGYPAEDHDQVLADLSVEHASMLDHYRAAEEISRSAASGTASTEDLRLAMIHYRALFRDLLGEPAGAGTGSAATEPAQTIEAEDTAPDGASAQAAETRRPVAAGDPVANGRASSSADQIQGS